MRTDRSPNDILFDAVRTHSVETAHRDPLSVRVSYTDGSSVTLRIPAGAIRVATPEEEAVPIQQPTVVASGWPPDTGWSFDHGRFSCDSQVFEMRGRPGEILRLLIRRGGSCDMEAIRAEVWGGYQCEDSVIRTAISRLRKNIAEIMGFPADFDPIDSTNNVYTLKHI